MNNSIEKGKDWFQSKGWDPYDFQLNTWQAYFDGKSGIVNAPTGSGKTYSLIVPILISNLTIKKKGLKAIWIAPIRALSKEISLATNRAIEGLGSDWRVAIRTGDTTSTEKAKIKSNPPDLLITTPESLHLLLAQKKYQTFFKNLEVVVADEWHELMGSKRGILVELALSRLKGISKTRVWGISATIGNMDESAQALLGSSYSVQTQIIRSSLKKKIEVKSILPDKIDDLPWAGHLGGQLLKKVIPVIMQHSSTLIFTNTRSQAEIWYKKILDAAPELAGTIAMHHSAISSELRAWVEENLHLGRLKTVVSTSSLDLGVDFRPVEAIIQVGSPKGVARFMQRAGRSGHQPGETSRIYFVPTHTLELIEAAALRTAIEESIVEARIPYRMSFDVLAQYLKTLSLSEGFFEAEIYEEIKETFCFRGITRSEWEWVLQFIMSGGESLDAYQDFNSVNKYDRGLFKIASTREARRHRLSIGTIVSGDSMKIQYRSGKYIGTIEEYFISRLNIGDTFWFAGRSLELINIKGMTAFVIDSKRKAGKIPSWQGGRMPLSSELSKALRDKLNEFSQPKIKLKDAEMKFILPLIDVQKDLSIMPSEKEFLIEYFKSEEGYHLFMYPFEGRFVHEGMAALIGYRMSLQEPTTLSIAMNDYGFELLSENPIPIREALETDLFSMENLTEDIESSINSTEMARRKFRDIAAISGLVFKGYPGHEVREKHLQSSSQLFFDVFEEHEPENLLLNQAYREVMEFQLEEKRMIKALERINSQKIILKIIDKPTPLCFPIMVDSLSREKLTNERIEDRIKRMYLEYFS